MIDGFGRGLGLALLLSAGASYGQSGDFDLLFGEFATEPGGEAAGAPPAAVDPAQDRAPTPAPVPEAAESAAAAQAAELDVIELPSSAEPLPQQKPPPRGRAIEEVVVTAQKREERIQDVPISVAAFSGAQLERMGVKATQDLALHTPGMVYDTVANFAIIYIRGVGTDAFLPSADTSVATYIDGVYFPSSVSLARALGPVQRVEVLKGPQGTLFGRNATGGAISVVTKDPDTEEWGGTANVSYGRFNAQEYKLHVGGPVSDELAVSASVLYSIEDNYYHVVAPSPLKELTDTTNKGAFLKAKWTPNEFLDATLSGFAISSIGGGSGLLPVLEPTLLGAALGVNSNADPYDYRTSVNENPYAYSDQYVGALTLNLHPGPLDIKSITAYQRMYGSAFYDFDGSSARLISFGLPRDDPQFDTQPPANYFTQEVQFISNPDSPLAEHLQLIAGLFYLRGTFGYDPLGFNVSTLAALTTPNLQGVPLLGSIPLLDQILTGAGGLVSALNLPRAGVTLAVRGALDTEAYAGFVQGTWTPLPWLGVTLGGRVSREERRVFNSSLGTVLYVGDRFTNLPLINYAEQSSTQENFSPKVSLDFRPAEDVLVYLSWQRAFKSGSYNIVNLTAPPTFVKPERVDALELGLKSEYFGGLIRVNGALFQTKLHDLQSQFTSLTSGGVVQFENAERATVRGAELEIVAALSESLLVNLSGTYLDGTYDRFPDAQGYVQARTLGMISGLSAGNFDYSGNRIVRNPRFSGTFGLNYHLLVPGGAVDLGGSYYYNSGYYYDAQNALEQPAFELVGLTASYTYEPWRLMVTAFGSNVLNEKHFVYKTQFNFGTAGMLAPPASYGLRLRWEF